MLAVRASPLLEVQSLNNNKMISTHVFYGTNINKAIELLVKNEIIFNCSNYGLENYKGKNITYCHISVVADAEKEYQKFLLTQNELVCLSGIQ